MSKLEMNVIIEVNEYLQSEFLYLLEAAEQHKKLFSYPLLIEITDERELTVDKVIYYVN